MRARAPWLCFPFLVVALLAPSPAAAASPLDIPAAVPAKFRALVRARLHSPKPRKSSWEPRFQLQTRRGYDLEVIGVDDIVGILVTRHQGTKPSSRRRSRRGTAVTAYVARGTVTSRRIEASFGKFGEVAVRFRPSPRPRKSTPRRRCKGRERFANRSGVFVGSVRFTGEHRYLAVRAHRVKGGIRTPLGRRCAPSRPRVPSRRYSRPVGGGADPFFQASFLQAGWREALASRGAPYPPDRQEDPRPGGHGREHGVDGQGALRLFDLVVSCLPAKRRVDGSHAEAATSLCWHRLVCCRRRRDDNLDRPPLGRFSRRTAPAARRPAVPGRAGIRLLIPDGDPHHRPFARDPG